MHVNTEGSFNRELLESIFRTSKKTIQEYVREIERNNRYKSVRGNVVQGTVLDDRSRLIDLYDACLQQDAHIRSVLETLESQILGDRYMLARMNEKGKYVKDVEETRKIQGTQFDKIIRGIVEAKLYGYTLLEIMPEVDSRTGKLAEVNIVERRQAPGYLAPELEPGLQDLPEKLHPYQLRGFRAVLGNYAPDTCQEVHRGELREFQPHLRAAYQCRKECVGKQHRPQEACE